MRVRAWIRRHWRARRLARAARKRGGDRLREFVYLDEVSVFSLISSRLGSVATEFTATESSSLTAENAASTVGNAGLLKSEVRSRAEATRTSGTQVLRKATVQGTFRELYRHIKDDFALSLPAAEHPTQNLTDFDRTLADAVSAGVATHVAGLRRGELIELEVQLDAEAIFHVATLMETFLELFHEMPDELAPGMRGQLGEAVAINAMMSKLLVGLVPLRGRAVDHAVVSTAGGEWVVDRRLLHALPGADVRDLHVVAMAEAPLFWKDIRRVLFARSRYTMLCRVGQDGLHDDWNPVKLADLVRRFLPEVADQLREAQRGLVGSLTSAVPALPPRSDEDRLREALLLYGSALAAHHDVQWNLADPAAAMAAVTGPAVEQRRPAFDIVAIQFARDAGVSTSPTVRAELRSEAMLTAGLGFGAGVASSEAAVQGPETEHARILEAEVVAIYW